MLVIPNTTTTATEQTAGAAIFPPGGDVGSLTPYASGYLFIANNSAQISIRKGPTSGQAQWTPYALVSPTMVPLSTDRGGRRQPDYIFGVKAIDGVAGTHAQVFGALFQAGEAGFVPSAQFGGNISTQGGFSPVSNFVELAFTEFSAPVAITATTEATAQTIVTTSAFTVTSGQICWVEFFCPNVQPVATAGAVTVAILKELLVTGGSTGHLSEIGPSSGTAIENQSIFAVRRFAPPTQQMQFQVAAYNNTAGTATYRAGTAGVGTLMPGFVRVLAIS